MDFFIFGYGSLVSKDSTERTLGRKLEEQTSDYCKLKGYERIWNFKGRVMTEHNQKVINAVFLNIMPSSNPSMINGFLFNVNHDELEKLKKRELNYDCIEVTNAIFDHSISLNNKKVFTFSCVDNNYLSSKDATDCFVLKNYELLVRDAFKKVGEDYYQEYEQTTLNHHYEFAEGSYRGVFD